MNNEIYHYGVPGMKWGHRKAVPVTNSVSAARTRMQKAKKAYKAVKKYEKQ